MLLLLLKQTIKVSDFFILILIYGFKIFFVMKQKKNHLLFLKSKEIQTFVNVWINKQ